MLNDKLLARLILRQDLVEETEPDWVGFRPRLEEFRYARKYGADLDMEA